MIVQDVYLTPIAGTNVVLSRSIKMITPIIVCHDGIEYDIVYSPTVPTNRQVAYRSGAGGLTFDSSIVFTGTEKIYLLRVL